MDLLAVNSVLIHLNIYFNSASNYSLGIDVLTDSYFFVCIRMYYFLVFWHPLLFRESAVDLFITCLLVIVLPRVSWGFLILFVEIRKRKLGKPYKTEKAANQRSGFSGRSAWFRMKLCILRVQRNVPHLGLCYPLISHSLAVACPQKEYGNWAISSKLKAIIKKV